MLRCLCYGGVAHQVEMPVFSLLSMQEGQEADLALLPGTVSFNSSECSCQPQLRFSSTRTDCLVQTKPLPALLRVEHGLHIKIFL